MDTPAQTLSGQWASSSFPANFGFALRGNTDLDRNGYPGTAERLVPFIYERHPSSFNSLYLLADLIVGAFGVDKAVLYRYIPLHTVAILLLHTYCCPAHSAALLDLRARPIVSASASLTVQPTMFNQEEKTCELTGAATTAVSW